MRLVERQREKTYQAMMYLLENTSNCYKKKLYKLLFLLDFEFFETTGRKVTHFDYFAWKMGPVPTELHEAVDSEDAELLERFDIVSEHLGNGYEAVALKSRFEFNPKFFSDAELDLLREIANRWHDATAKELEDFTHRDGTPWDRVWNKEHKHQQVIPEEYALDQLNEDDREVILHIANERAEVLANYR